MIAVRSLGSAVLVAVIMFAMVCTGLVIVAEVEGWRFRKMIKELAKAGMDTNQPLIVLEQEYKQLSARKRKTG